MVSRLRWFFTFLIFPPTLAWNVLLGRVLRVRHWWDVIDEGVILGALPFASDVARLHAEGVVGVINMCAEYAGPQKAYRTVGIEQLRLPTLDFTHPALADVERGVDFIRRCRAEGGGVYIHCKAGRARSATVVACWMIEEYDISPEEAQARILQRRAHVNPRLAERPVVREFYRKHTDRG